MSTKKAGPTSKISSGIKWLFRKPSYVGLVGALVGYFCSMTPTLIPRSWGLQALLAGLSAVIGYGIGSLMSSIFRHWYKRQCPKKTRRFAWITLLLLGPVVILASTALGTWWDEQLRILMDMPIKEPWEALSMILLSLLFASILLLIARIIRGLFKLLARGIGKFLPPYTAKALGYGLALFFIVYVVLGGLAQNIFQAIDYAASIQSRTIQSDLTPPTSPLRSGSPESLVTWEQLGAKGREFIAGGPTAEEINSFSARTDTKEPIRIYGGLDAADTLESRVELVMKELERTNALTRKAIFIQTPSGNGEVPPVNADAPEYILNGDTAQVVLQYSYAPSATTMLTNPGVGSEAGRQMVNAVIREVSKLPEDSRPKIYVAGESLGSLSTEAAFESADDMQQKVDGVLMVGPTFLNQIRKELIDSRSPDSPVWLPVINGGSAFRFATTPTDLQAPGSDWGAKRYAYLANSSDPVGWFSVRALYSRPDFLDEPRGHDISPSMTWVPIVTFWQTLLDLQFASGAPAGHGHRYGLNVVDGWAGVINPDGWTGSDTAKLRDTLQPVLDEYLSPD